MPRSQLSKLLRERDWWGVAIDLFILVVGVFLGIQAANWNEARKQQADGRYYVQRMRDDLSAEVRSLDQHELYWRDTAEAGNRALAYAEDGKPRAPWLLLNDFYGAGQNWNHSTINGTYDELRSAGRLDLIDGALRERLADYYVAREDEARYLAESTSDYRLHIRAAVPFRLQRIMIDRCQRGFVRLYTGQCPEPMPTADVEAVVRGIANDKQLIGELRSWMANLDYVRSIGRQRRVMAQRLIEEIDRSQR